MIYVLMLVVLLALSGNLRVMSAMADWIERFPVPERNGFKGSVIALSLLFGLIAAPEVGLWVGSHHDCVQVEDRLVETPLVFPVPGRGGNDDERSCVLEIASMPETGVFFNQQIEIAPPFCQVMPEWTYVSRSPFGDCSTRKLHVGETCANLMLTVHHGTGEQHCAFSFPTPAYVRIVPR